MVHELVERQARRTPDAIAIADEAGGGVTYRELDERADQLARRLRAAGAGQADTIVAVWLPRSAGLVVAELAVLKSGAAYLPLDPALGEQRVGAILADSRAALVVTSRDQGVPADLPAGMRVLYLDDPAPEADPTPETEPDRPVPGTDDRAGVDRLCYVIYTSGSTGAPKGVAVTHRSVQNLCRWYHRRFSLSGADRSALVCSPSFDGSVGEIWPALTCGASLAMVPERSRLDSSELARWYASAGVTISLIPTALGEALLAAPEAVDLPLRYLLLGGEALRRRPPAGFDGQVVNIYGPTETTVLVTEHVVAPDGGHPIPIGGPIDNVRLHLLDEHLRPVPAGTVGELYVGGPVLARGYLHRPELTTERFRPDPSGQPGERMYRTGDLARWTSAGELEFCGRTDDQVKVRGFRVEPGDVTQVLRSLPGVSDAVVVPLRNGREAYLAAYVVPANGEGADEARARLRHELGTRLPDHLVPRRWAFLDALPRNANGKLDRAALPASALTAPSPHPAAAADNGARTGGGNGAVPATPLEQALHHLWCKELDVDHAPADASFFDLGGHSVNVIRLLNRVRATFGVGYPVLEFFRRPTLAAMVARLGGTAVLPSAPAAPADESAGPAPAAPGVGEVVAEVPASYQQGQMAAGRAAMHVLNIPLRIDVTGELDVTALGTAFTALVERHVSLRTRYGQDGDTWMQRVYRAEPVTVPVEDLSGLPDDERLARADELGREEAHQGIDVTAEAPFRLRLVQLAPDHWVLFLVLHHIAADGWAVAILLRELGALYRAARTGEPGDLPAPAMQCTDFARWQAEYFNPAERTRRLDHWATELRDAPMTFELPTDRAAPAKLSGAGRMHSFAVPADLRDRVDELARQRGGTEFSVLWAAFAVLLARLSGEHDITLRVPYVNRAEPAHEELVTITAGVMPLRLRLADANTFGELVDQAGTRFFAAVDNFLPLAWIIEAMGAGEVRADRSRLLPVGFVYQNSLGLELELTGASTEVTETPIQAARGPLWLQVTPVPDGLRCDFEYSADLFDADTMAGWADRYTALLDQVTQPTDPDLDTLLG